VIDDHHVNSEAQKAGKQVDGVKRSVAADGDTMTVEWVYYGNPTGGPVNGVDTWTRVGKAPAGSNAISGSWRQAKADVATSDALIVTFKTAGDSLSMTTPTGQSYDAKIDGKEAPYMGDPGTTSVSLKRIGNSIVETDYRDGKVISIALMSVAADGKTMTIDVDDRLHGTKGTYIAEKQ
jgi:hypothetical protein